MSIESDWFKLPRYKREEAHREARRLLGHGESLGIAQLWSIHLSLKKVV